MRYKIVVFSWTGNTAACAVALGQALEAETFLLEEEKDRQGGKGFALGGTQASFGMKTALKALPDITDAEVIVLGMPVWAGTTPPAINTFFQHCSVQGKHVYVFATQQSDSRPQKLENRLKKLINGQGGTFVHLFMLCVPRGKQLGVEDAAARTDKWAERIRTGE